MLPHWHAMAVANSLSFILQISLLSWWELPWCIGGGFHVVRFPSERPSGAGYSTAMEEFSDFIFMQNLVDRVTTCRSPCNHLEHNQSILPKT